MFCRKCLCLANSYLLLNIFSVYVNSYVNHLVDVRFFSSIIVVVMMFWFILIAKILIIRAVINASVQAKRSNLLKE